jgi:ABC-type microcin C transport system duplicated ATPase subunit YejF
MVFQDPYCSSNPHLAVRDIIAEPLEAMQLTQNRSETICAFVKLQQLPTGSGASQTFPSRFLRGDRDNVSLLPEY